MEWSGSTCLGRIGSVDWVWKKITRLFAFFSFFDEEGIKIAVVLFSRVIGEGGQASKQAWCQGRSYILLNSYYLFVSCLSSGLGLNIYRFCLLCLLVWDFDCRDYQGESYVRSQRFLRACMLCPFVSKKNIIINKWLAIYWIFFPFLFFPFLFFPHPL